MGAAIVADGLGKRYRLGEGAHAYVTLRETLARGRRRSRETSDREEIWALLDVSLRVEEGDVVGIVGRNGAGKTTLLKTVARIVRPTTGVVRVRGRVGALLEVGTGFHPELTGRENVYLNGVVLGMSRREVRRKFDEIVEFAGVERFLDTPLKRYSSGMYLRLAFSVAAHIDPDVIIVDEVLAVGDAEFQRRCLGRMSEFGREGRTVLFVSHDTGAVGRLCRRAVWLESGRIRDDGPAHEIIERYLRSMAPVRSRASLELPPSSPVQNVALELTDEHGAPHDSPRRDETLRFVLRFETSRPLPGLDAAIYLIDRSGLRVVNENVSYEHPEAFVGGPSSWSVSFTVPPVLAAGEYVAGLWIGTSDERFVSSELFEFTVLPLPEDGAEAYHGVVRPAVSWRVERKASPPGA